MYQSKLREKLKEALGAVGPIAFIVLLLSLTIVPVPSGTLLTFLFGSVLLVVGMMFFTLGAELSMEPMGNRIGGALTGTRKLPLILAGGLVLGTLITVSEPDLQVLAGQVQSIPNSTLILSISIGVGIFLAISILRILLQVPLAYLLIGLYTVIFLLAFFAPGDFLAIAFDAGGVTTGPMTVPFIMSFGVGIAAIRSDHAASDDSMGLIALCSVGPILTVLILSLIYQPENTNYAAALVPDGQGGWLGLAMDAPARDYDECYPLVHIDAEGKDCIMYAIEGNLGGFLPNLVKMGHAVNHVDIHKRSPRPLVESIIVYSVGFYNSIQSDFYFLLS